MTDFIRSLAAIEHDHAATAVVEKYLAEVKKVPRYRSKEIGVLADEPDIWYFYYLIERGVLEVRVEKVDGQYARRVTDYITRPVDVKAMLGDWHPSSRVRSVPPVVFKPPR